MQENYNYHQVLAAACLSLLVFGVGLISLGSMLPDLMERFDLDDLEAGGLASLLPAGILAGSVVFGPVVDRYSYRHLLTLSLLLIFAGLEGIALAESYFLLQVAFVLIGFGGGAINGAGSALAADISEGRPGSRGANLSLIGVFFGLGALGVPVLLGALSDVWPQQTIIAAIGGLVLVVTVFVASIRYPQPKQPQRIPLRKGLELLREAPLLLLGFVLFFQSGVESLLNNWTTTYLQGALSVKPADALFALSLSVLGLTTGRLLLAGLLKRIAPYRLLLLSLTLSLAGGLLLAFSAGYALPVAGLVLAGLGLAAGFPVILGYVGDLYANLSGTAFGLALVIALTGNMIINFLMGAIAQNAGIGRFPLFFVLCLVLEGVVLFFALRRVAKRTGI